MDFSIVLLLALCFKHQALLAEARKDDCTYYTESDDVIADCSDMGLHSPPSHLQTNITKLVLSHNTLTVLPDGCFSSLTKLEELDMSYNHKYLVVEANSLRGLSRLRTLNLNWAKGAALGCNHTRPFRHVAATLESLLMSGLEFCADCVNDSLQDLSQLRYLSVSWPDTTLPDGFSYLRRLEILDLSESQFRILNEETFQALSNLSVSRIALRKLNNNNGFRLRFPVLTHVRHALKVLDFSCNRKVTVQGIMANASSYFSPIIADLENTTLHTLILDHVFSLDLPVTLSSNQFRPLKHVPLQALSIQKNAISVVLPFLSYLRELRHLNVNYNAPMYADGDIGKIFRDMFVLRRLKIVELSNLFFNSQQVDVCEQGSSNPMFLGPLSGDPDDRTTNSFKSIRNPSPKKSEAVQKHTTFKQGVHFRENNALGNDVSRKNFEYPLHLKELRLDESGNFSAVTSEHRTERSHLLESLEPLEVPSSDGPVQSATMQNSPVIKLHCTIEDINMTNIGMRAPAIRVNTVYVSELDVTNFTHKGTRVYLTNKVKTVDISSNSLGRIDVVIYGLNSLEYIHLKDNNLERIQPLFFRAIPNIKHIALSKNGLGMFPEREHLVTLFSGLPKVELVDLSTNQLKEIPHGMFGNCPNLRTLLLRNNSLERFNLDFDNLTNIEEIDLQNNNIRGFTEEQTETLKGSNTVLRLRNNSGFECSCDNMAFIAWIQSENCTAVIPDKSELICKHPNGKQERLVNVKLFDLQLRCIQNVLILTGSTLIVVVLCSIILAWHFRWYIKYWIYVLRLKRRHVDIHTDNDREYDVYLSYDEEDYQIADTVRKNLEDMELSVFFRDRDFELGESLYEECVRGIEASRKNVMCVTNNFLECGDRYFETQMSFTRGRGFIVVVVIGDISIEKLSKPLRTLLRNDVYFEWPNNENDAEMFWKTLKKAVKTRKGLVVRKRGYVMYYAD